MKSKGFIIIVAIVLIVFVYNAAYTVDETEQVVITQFGRIVGEPKIEPGPEIQDPLHSKSQLFSQKSSGMGRRPRPDPHPGQDLHLGGHLCPLENRRPHQLFSNGQQPLQRHRQAQRHHRPCRTQLHYLLPAHSRRSETRIANWTHSRSAVKMSRRTSGIPTPLKSAGRNHPGHPGAGPAQTDATSASNWWMSRSNASIMWSRSENRSTAG